MPPSKPRLPPPTEPKFSRRFDPWNSASTGHQRAETCGPQGWRESRNMKMNRQFRAGNSGGERISDAVGVGSEDFDERLGLFVPKEVRARAMNSVADMLRNPGTMRAALRPSAPSPSVSRLARTSGEEGLGNAKGNQGEGGSTAEEKLTLDRKAEDEARDEENARRTQERKIFDGLVIYVNGSTYPLVSDHKLKYLLSEHGARMSSHLGRGQVTHVILGKPSGPNGGAGGGLASGKLEKEIRRVGGCSIKFVGVEWVLESIKAGRRLPEARFANLKIAARRQQSVLGAFSKADGSTQPPVADTPGT
ncbi:hypothetical protein C7999DRAFT_41827 [Corynascus novoguineensis]|uniref:BRCT domain-containing protein n=1 Tax=Corynascus novoguineensis TaxID=1126955 RepID=A0AAN7CTU6_9PEZI|nr:hypothetical protein C7999DRAFT_41827 [Corynascus novoguineensis]